MSKDKINSKELFVSHLQSMIHVYFSKPIYQKESTLAEFLADDLREIAEDIMNVYLGNKDEKSKSPS